MISSGVVEGFNGKAKLTTRKAYGLRTPQGIEFAMFHVMGYPTRAGMHPQILLRRSEKHSILLFFLGNLRFLVLSMASCHAIFRRGLHSLPPPFHRRRTRAGSPDTEASSQGASANMAHHHPQRFRRAAQRAQVSGEFARCGAAWPSSREPSASCRCSLGGYPCPAVG